MLPGQAVRVCCSVRPGSLLVLHFPCVQASQREGDGGRGAEAGGCVAEEPDGYRSVQVRLSARLSPAHARVLAANDNVR